MRRLPWLLVIAMVLAGGAVERDIAAQDTTMETATFAGGCFWCLEEALDKVPGVVSTTSGYTGGQKDNPTYEEVSEGGTGHAESVEVIYDSGKVNFEQLLEVFWHNVDPTTPDRQFCDKGRQYRSAVFYRTPEQRQIAEDSKKQLEQHKPFKEPIVTEIVPASRFYPAEEYHQNYYQKNPIRYKFYKYSCGRAQRLEEVWGHSS